MQFSLKLYNFSDPPFYICIIDMAVFLPHSFSLSLSLFTFIFYSHLQFRDIPTVCFFPMSSRVITRGERRGTFRRTWVEAFLEKILLDCSTLHILLALQLSCEISDELLVHQWIDVLAELIEDKPIADLTLVADDFNLVMRRETRACS